ncbi:MAG: hypothetical protein QE271_05365 [Bacteriovoracaceae bacterium]|nr:hypothetical protein [Bacteriovoracaceae bacterium]
MGVYDKKKIFQGEYDYLYKGAVYCEENFELTENIITHNITYHAKLISRSDTGQVMRSVIDYELYENLNPLNINIKHYLGHIETEENFAFNTKDHTIYYTWQKGKEKKTDSKMIQKKFVIGTPATICMGIIALNKKIDTSVPRAPLALIKTDNFIDYNGGLKEETLYLSYEMKERELVTISDKKYECVECKIYPTDNMYVDPNIGFPIAMKLNRKFAIPFKLVIGDDTEIVIKKFKEMMAP